MPIPKKPRDQRIDGHNTKDVTLSESRPPVPTPPKDLLPYSKKLWHDYWANSEVVRAIDPISDRHIVRRWIMAVDEYERLQPDMAKNPTGYGNQGQTILNPIAGYLTRLRAEILHCESELGLTPMSRLRLGIAASDLYQREANPQQQNPTSDTVIDAREMMRILS